MREPGIDAPGPLLQIQFGKRRAINLLRSKQNIAHFPLRMAGNPTKSESEGQTLQHTSIPLTLADRAAGLYG